MRFVRQAASGALAVAVQTSDHLGGKQHVRPACARLFDCADEPVRIGLRVYPAA